MQKINSTLVVALAAICLTLIGGQAAAQPAASMPEEPTVLECREAHTASQLCPAATTPNPGGGGGGRTGGGGGGGGGVDLPHACIYGDFVNYDEYVTQIRARGMTPAARPRGYRELRMRHDDVALPGSGTADVGHGGVCLCPAGFGIRPLAASYDATGEVAGLINRSIDRRNSMQCVPTGGTQTSVDIGPLEIRLDQDERTLFLHMCSPHHPGMSSEDMLMQHFAEWQGTATEPADRQAIRRNELCPPVDTDTDTNNTEELWRRWCVRAGNDVTFEEFNAATPARREEMCPPSESEEGGSDDDGLDHEFMLELGAQAAFGNVGSRDGVGFIGARYNLCPDGGNNCLQIGASIGLGRMGGMGGLEVGRHLNLSANLGLEHRFSERFRMQFLGTGSMVQDPTGIEVNGVPYAFGIRAYGFGARVGATVDINRSSRDDRAITPFVGMYVGYEATRFNLANNAGQAHWDWGGNFMFGASVGLRFGRR